MLFIAALNIKKYEGRGIFFVLHLKLTVESVHDQLKQEIPNPYPEKNSLAVPPASKFHAKILKDCAISRLRVASFSDLFAVLHTFKLRLVYLRKKSVYINS